MDFRNKEVNRKEDSFSISMEAPLLVVYRSESTGEYECFETVVPLSGAVELAEHSPNEIYWMKLLPIEMGLEPREDYDGEARMFGLSMVLGVTAQLYREEVQEALVDAYSLEKELVIERKPMMVQQLLMKNVSKVRLLEQVHLEPNKERILQMCGCNGRITVDRVEKLEDGVRMEGVLSVDVLYNTTDDNVVYAQNNCQIPFEQFVEVDGPVKDADVWYDAQIEQLQVNLLDNSEYEVKAILQIALMVIGYHKLDNIVQIEEEPLDMDVLNKQPGMIGYARKEEEELWDIAKKYHANPTDIIEIGDKVLVVKQVK
jgi:hypothetical protein